MTAKEIQKRNERAEQLRVLKLNRDTFYVESAEGKICYRVIFSDKEMTCTCGDFTKNIRTDANFHCKHILALLNTEQGQMLQAEFLEKKNPELNKNAIINIKGKDFVVYSGVLDLSHQRGLQKLEVELLQYPTKENGKEAICKAIAVSKLGEEFVDVGDANPSNCAAMISKHIIRMASTRAKARVLRDMCNVGLVAVEELADFDDVIGVEPTRPAKQTRRTSPKKSNGNGDKGKTESSEKKEAKLQSKEPPVKPVEKKEPSTEMGKPEESTSPKISIAQRRACSNLARRRGHTVEDLENMIQENYNTSLEDLSSKQAAEFIRQLQAA